MLPPNSRFLGPGIFREFEIREFKIHDFPPNSLYYNRELVGFFLLIRELGGFFLLIRELEVFRNRYETVDLRG